MKTGKTPGTDGLTVDFYLFFWKNIKTLLFKCFCEIQQRGIMSEEQRRAVLKLIPKKGKDITDLKNWRPISLLNTDY